MILDFMYGYIWYPEYMYFATTTVHHSAYLFMEYKLWRAGILAPFSVYFPQEIPTFLLQAKRYWDIRDNTYETIFGISFMLLRIVYYCLVSFMLRDEITSDYFFVFGTFMNGATRYHTTHTLLSSFPLHCRSSQSPWVPHTNMSFFTFSVFFSNSFCGSDVYAFLLVLRLDA
jgi:hypothetical protein